MLNLRRSREFTEIIQHALECRSRKAPYVFDVRAWSSKYYVVTLDTHWGLLLPNEYRDSGWLSQQPIDVQKQFWAVYLTCGPETAINTVHKVSDKPVATKKTFTTRYLASLKKCTLLVALSNVDDLTIGEISIKYPVYAVAVLRKALEASGAIERWDMAKKDFTFYRKGSN